MKPKKRQKLCYNCEGDVDLDVIVCPFCAADLREEKPELNKSAFSPSITSVKQLNTENSLYPSPYGRSIQSEEPAPVAMEEIENQPMPLYEEKAPAEWKSILPALLSFSLGVQLFLLGVLLVLFSDRGIMLLKWDASFWFLYLFASIPLLLFGYRYLSKY
jgi:hypothetical protein